MTSDIPEVVAWRWFKPIVNDHGETVGGAWKLGGAPGFLPWWPNDPLIRLSDYERLQAVHNRLLKHLQHLIDQTTPLEPEPGNPMWSRRIQLDEVIAERDKLRVECEELAEALEAMLAVNVVEADVSYGTACAKAEQALDDHRKGGDQCTTNA